MVTADPNRWRVSTTEAFHAAVMAGASRIDVVPAEDWPTVVIADPDHRAVVHADEQTSNTLTAPDWRVETRGVVQVQPGAVGSEVVALPGATVSARTGTVWATRGSRASLLGPGTVGYALPGSTVVCAPEAHCVAWPDALVTRPTEHPAMSAVPADQWAVHVPGAGWQPRPAAPVGAAEQERAAELIQRTRPTGRSNP